MHQKHRRFLPNRRQQGVAFGAAPKGAALHAAPFGVLVVFHLVRISDVLASFLEPVLAQFLTKFADSENSLSQGDCLKNLLATSYFKVLFFSAAQIKTKMGARFGKKLHFRLPGAC